MNLRILSLSTICIILTHSLFAQTILSEDFESGSPGAWSQTTNATDGGWLFGTATTMSSAYWAVNTSNTTNISASNDDNCNCDKSVDYFITPTLDLSSSSSVFMNFDVYFGGYTYGGATEVLTIEASTNGGSSWTVVQTISGDGSQWRLLSVDLSAYAGNSNVKFAFRYNDGGGWTFGAAIDNVLIYEGQQYDMSAISLDLSTTVGLNQAPLTISGTMTNYGSATVTSMDINYSVNSGATVTQSLSGLNIATFGTYNYTFSTQWMPPSTGVYTVDVWATNINGNADQNTVNDIYSGNITVVSAAAVRLPLYEEFTSSTCGPCAGFNASFNPLLASNNCNVTGGNVAAIKYQMNWPSPGNDPSYNPDGAARQSFYGVSGIPDPWIDGGSANGTQGEIDTRMAVPALMDIDATHTIAGNTITVDVTVNPFADFSSSNLKLHIAVTEDSYNYTGTNGETEFFQVLRKMLPTANGTSIGPLTNGTPVSHNETYSFTVGGVAQGNYNLWLGMSNVTVVVFVQDNSTKEIHQAALTTLGCGTSGPSITSTSVDNGCGTPSGSIDITVSSGTAPFTYLWSNGATTEDITGLTAGSYTVVVTDASGCVTNQTITVNDAGATINLTTSVTDANCSANDGTASVTPTGGTLPYTYQWDASAANQTTQTATGLAAGTYSVTVTDASGCISIGSATIVSAGSGPALTSSVTDVLCNGESTGSATITATGSGSPYSYQWDASTGNQTSQTATGLAVGTYSVTVTDANGCISTSTVVISEPTLMTATTSTTEPICGASDGTITIVATGGTGGYYYSWDASAGSQTSATATGLAAGSYTVSVTDGNACVEQFTATLSNIGAGTLTTTVVNVTCNGANDGSISTLMQGGTSPYAYSWNNGSISSSVSGLSGGTYLITVTDANNCIVTESVIVNEPDLLVINTSYQNVSASSACDGTATANVTGGILPYIYLWDDSNNQTAQTATGLCSDTYTVVITDSNNCTSSASVFVDSIPMGMDNKFIGEVLIYPNPTNGIVNLSVDFLSEKDALIQVYSFDGRLIETRSYTNVSDLNTIIDLNTNSKGMYFVRLSTESVQLVKRIVFE